jgi:glutamate-1-semialdehyde 2,1-aminomutase
MAEGSGSRLCDVDGREYVDYLLGLGPMILGHRHPVVTRAVTSAVSELGTCFGLPCELEIEAARKVTEAVPGVDLVRFSNSGSEVVGTAVRLARAHTGRRLIIRFEGHYHGWQDTVYWSNHVDPSLAGPASRPRPVPLLRELTRRHGALLIFDEVITGFRFARGGTPPSCSAC